MKFFIWRVAATYHLAKIAKWNLLEAWNYSYCLREPYFSEGFTAREAVKEEVSHWI